MYASTRALIRDCTSLGLLPPHQRGMLLQWGGSVDLYKDADLECRFAGGLMVRSRERFASRLKTVWSSEALSWLAQDTGSPWEAFRATVWWYVWCISS